MITKTPPTKDSHCSYCGSRFAEQILWPRRCFLCGNDSYKNPIPIVVMLVRVFKRGAAAQCGWLIEQRNIPPEKGGWALPSGYVNHGETWQIAAARELEEEVGLKTNPEDFSLIEIINSTVGNMLIFCSCEKTVYEDEIAFVPNEEVSAIQFPILPSHLQLCFPSHNEMWSKHYFNTD